MGPVVTHALRLPQNFRILEVGLPRAPHSPHEEPVVTARVRLPRRVPDATRPFGGRRCHHAARNSYAMAKRKDSRHGLRQRLERSAELYLARCYGRRTAARADEFAGYLSLTRPYLSRVVPEVLGVPLRDFLRQRQLAYACRLLETTNVSTVEIAYAAAFGTRPTFYRCFVAAFGITPGEYRRRHSQVTK